MHPNPAFHTASDSENLAFARDRAFGVLAVAGDGPPMISHVPFVLAGDGKSADLHLVRSNPIIRALTAPLATRIVVSGPGSYISPDWYGLEDQVPTWNYVAVHLTGTLERRPQGELPGLLDRQSTFFEERLAPKPVWRMDKVAPDALDKMMRMIVPCRMTITQVEGTWKLAQNKPETARTKAADQVAAFGMGVDVRALSALMRGV